MVEWTVVRPLVVAAALCWRCGAAVQITCTAEHSQHHSFEQVGHENEGKHIITCYMYKHILKRLLLIIYIHIILLYPS